MRLLYAEAEDRLVFRSFDDEDEVPKYIILSHTWLSDAEEVSYADVIQGSNLNKAGYRKIQLCLERAINLGLEYICVDTCCIDKSNSTELGEAINSMYRRYHNAYRCYVHLEDVSIMSHDTPSLFDQDTFTAPAWEASFRNCKWFTRGWTLQELLAPTSVEFFSAEGTRLGGKASLQKLIHQITGIPHEALQGEPLAHFTVAERMSWSHGRRTKRNEDKTYALLGILDVSMSLRYGEGQRVFERLEKKAERKEAESLSKHAERLAFNHQLDKLPASPSAAYNSFTNRNRSTCLPGTRSELLQDIMTWPDAHDDRCIYWLTGDAGFGKSTIARTVASEHDDRGSLSGSFFFSRGNSDASKADLLFTTIASQLARRMHPAKRHICTAISHQKPQREMDLQDQWECFVVNPLAKLEATTAPTKLVLVIDALDECENDKDIEVIMQLLSTVKMLKNVRLRILVTSRPSVFKNFTSQQLYGPERNDVMLRTISPTLVDQDLTLYIEANLPMILQQRGMPSSLRRDRALAQLVKMSRGLFIAASTAALAIRDGGHGALDKIIALVDSLRLAAGRNAQVDHISQLDHIYIAILRSVVPAESSSLPKEAFHRQLRQILSAVVVLKSPLTTRSLAALLEIKEDSLAETLSKLKPVLEIVSNSIQLRHHTFRDFIVDRSRCDDPHFWVDGKPTHLALTRHCLRVMSRSLKRNICSICPARWEKSRRRFR